MATCQILASKWNAESVSYIIQINRIMIILLNLHKVNEFENKAVEFGKLH